MSIQELDITIQRGEAAHDVVQRTAHRFSGRYAVSVVEDPAYSVLRLRGTIEEPGHIEREFRAALLDDVLRCRIEHETAVLRRLIVETALRAALRDADGIS